MENNTDQASNMISPSHQSFDYSGCHRQGAILSQPKNQRDELKNVKYDYEELYQENNRRHDYPAFVVTNAGNERQVTQEESDGEPKTNEKFKEKELKNSIMTYVEYSAKKERESTPPKKLFSFNENH